MIMAPVALMGFLFGQDNYTKKSPQVDAVSLAIPAQSFPGERMPAVPAIPPGTRTPKTENSIVIHSPAGGAGWVRGQGQYFSTLQIEWSWNLKGSAEKFTINLLKGGALYKKLATVNVSRLIDRLSEDRWSWQWDIPLDTPTGSDYTIEVSTTLGKQKISAVNYLPFAILGEAVTVKGRFVDRYTEEPVSGVTMTYYSDPSNRVTADANGEFAYTVSTDPSRDVTKSYLYSPSSCYLQGWVTTGYALGSAPFYPNIFNYNQIGNFYTFDAYSRTKFIGAYDAYHDFVVTPILGDTVTIERPLWPAANVQIVSDIPVKVAMDYSQTNYTDIPDYLFNPIYTSASEDYATTALLKNAIPSDYNVRILLKDQAGNKYASPVYRVGREYKCKTLTVNFTNKEFRYVAQ